MQTLVRLPSHAGFAGTDRRFQKCSNHSRRLIQPIGSGHLIQKELPIRSNPLRTHHPRQCLQKIATPGSLGKPRNPGQRLEHLARPTVQATQDRRLNERLISVAQENANERLVPLRTRRGSQGEGQFPADSRRRIRIQRHEGLQQALGGRIRTAHPRFRQSHGMPSHPFIRIGESGLQMTHLIQGLQPIERIQGMHASQRHGGFLEQTLQFRHGGRILTFMDEARNRLAHPSIRAFESGHAVTDRGLTPTPRGRPPEALRNHPPNAAAIIAAIEIQVLLDGLRDGPRVLDDLPVHVHDVKTTVRTILEMHWTKPRVPRSQKLNSLLIGRTPRHPAHAIGMQLLPVNQITPGIADENRVDEVRAIGVATVHRRSGGSREIAGNPPTTLDHAWNDATDAPPGPNNAPGLIGTDPEDFGGRPVGRDAHPRRRQGDPGIARGMRPVQGHPLEVIAVAAHKSIPHRIEGQTILPTTGLGTDRLGQWIEAEIQPAQIERRRLGTRTENPIPTIGSRGSV